jgi:2-polyprenyl-6-methoxyphenol hydroxylase-like FAD-dependent oxidoreductase
VKRSVEIAGGGIAGLTAGLALAQKGWRVRVHERAGSLRSTGEAIHLWENGVRVLGALGALGPVISGVIPAFIHERRTPDGKAFSISRFGLDARLYVVLQARLLSTLYEALVETGGEIVFDSRAVAAEPDGSLHFADGSSRQADLVIGADGIASSIRDSLGLLQSRRAANQFGYQAVVRRDPAVPDAEDDCVLCEYWSGSRCLLYAPATSRLALVQLTSLAGDFSGNTVPIDRASWMAEFPKLASVIDHIPDDGQGEWFEIVRPLYWSSGRVAIIGDAAIGQPPILGHGAGCSMMSAFALAQTVDRTSDVEEALVEWETRERPFMDWVQWIAYQYGQLAFLPTGPRKAIFKTIDASGWLKRHVLLAAVSRDVTERGRYLPSPPPKVPICPLIH